MLSIVQRKLTANLSVSTSSFWVAAIPIGAAVWLLAVKHPTRPIATLRARVPWLEAGVLAALVGAVLGSLLNDSGLVVGGVAVMVLAAAGVHLLMVHEAPPSAG